MAPENRLDNPQLQGIEIVFAGKNNPIYRFDSMGAKEYPQSLTVELSIPAHLRYTYLQQGINSNCDHSGSDDSNGNSNSKSKQLVTSRIKTL